MAEYRAATFAESTKRTYRSHRVSYYNFCRQMCIPPVPATEETLAKYAAYLARRLKANSVKQYLNIIRIMHLEAGLENPAKDSFHLKTTLRGIDRIKGTTVARKTPVTPELLMKIRNKVNFGKRDDCVFWAACVVMFFGLFRKSNLFHIDKRFSRTAFVINGDRSMTIKVCWSKTIQFQEREFEVMLPTIHPHPLCPVKAMCLAFHQTTPAPAHSPAFPISGECFDKRLKSAVAGEEGNFSSHSFRRGGATWALSRGVPGEVIKMMGDWKSSAYLAYVDQLPKPIVDYYRVQCLATLP